MARCGCGMLSSEPQGSEPRAFRTTGLPKRLKYGIPNGPSLSGTGSWEPPKHPGRPRQTPGAGTRPTLRSQVPRSQVKPAPFAYHRARSVAEAIALLTELGDEAKI